MESPRNHPPGEAPERGSVSASEPDPATANCPASTEPLPYASSLEHLCDELGRIDMLVRMQVVRVRHAVGDDAYRGLTISERDVDDLLTRPPGSTPWAAAPELAMVAARLAERGREIATRRAQSRALGVPLRLEMLAERFALTQFDIDVLLIGLAPELDTRYERLYGYLHDDVTRKRPTVDLALSLLCASFADRVAGQARFGDEAPLVKQALIELQGDASAQRLTRLARAFRLEPRVLDYLLAGEAADTLDSRLLPHARMIADRLAPEQLLLPAALKTRLLALANAPAPRPVFYFQGPEGSGRKSVAAMLATCLGQRLLAVDLASLAGAGGPVEAMEHLLRLGRREQRLQGAVLLLEHADVVLGEGNAWLRPLLERMIEQGQGDALVLVAGEQPLDLRLRGRPWLHVELPLPGTEDRTRLWQRALAGGLGLGSDVDLAALAAQVRLTGGQIERAAASAQGLARLRLDIAAADAAITMAELGAAVRRHSQPRLGTLARKIPATSTWEDLVVSDDRQERLREIAIHARHRAQVLEHWGFARKLPTGRGLSVLFSGPPGTGKTLAASVIAGELGLDLYQIDLSAVVSKYIGETEKQLGRVFAEAEGSHAVLFFDEADALFGKRGETRDAHDRYANMEVAYLLQRMDSYEGVVILATNLSRNMDEAFTRRLRFIVQFPLPDEAERRRIWEAVLPSGVPRAAELDLGLMARRFDLAGGYIRNIALAATFLAADEGQPLAVRHLLKAARREYQKMGKMVEERMFEHG